MLKIFPLVRELLLYKLFDPPRLPNRNYRCDFIACSPSRGELQPVSFTSAFTNCRVVSPASGERGFDGLTFCDKIKNLKRKLDRFFYYKTKYWREFFNLLFEKNRRRYPLSPLVGRGLG